MFILLYLYKKVNNLLSIGYLNALPFYYVDINF